MPILVYDCDKINLAETIKQNSERFFQSLGLDKLQWRIKNAAVDPPFLNVSSRELLVCLRGASVVASLQLPALNSADSQRNFIFTTICGSCEPNFFPIKLKKCIVCSESISKTEKSIQCSFCFRWRHVNCVRHKGSEEAYSHYVCDEAENCD